MDAPTYGSTFSGIGGLDLAVEIVFGARALWQCERSAYCREVLAQHWPGVACFDDVRTIGSAHGTPRPEIICGGFPCQDVSAAGPRVGLERGARTGLWRELDRIIGELGPAVVVLENVPGLLRRGADRVLSDLASRGFDAEWGCLRASDVGAPHRRERVFVLAYSDRERLRQLAERIELRSAERRDPEPIDAGPDRGMGGAEAGHGMADADDDGRGSGSGSGSERDHDHGCHARGGVDHRSDAHEWPPGPADAEGWAQWSGARPAFRRSPDGVPGWVDRARVADGLRRARLRALGNAVVRQQAAAALRELVSRAVR